MSEQNVEAVRAIYERWAEGDFGAGVELYDSDTVLVQGPDFPESGEYFGLAGFRRYMRLFLSSYSHVTIAAVELIECGDNVVVEVFQSGAGAGSGAFTDFRYFHLWTFNGPKVARLENFRDRASALQAAGG